MSWYDAIKDAIDVAKRFDQTELYDKLLKLREEMSELRDDNIAKTEKIRELEEQLKLKALIEFDKGVYWIRNDPAAGGECDTPICPNCYDSEKKVMRLPICTLSSGPVVYCWNCKLEQHVK